MPNVERIKEAQVVCVDPSFGEATLAVARAAKAAGKPLVSSDAPYESELAALADAVAISGELMAHDRRREDAQVGEKAEQGNRNPE